MPFRLLSLSPELRNRIYELYYEDEDATSDICLNSLASRTPPSSLTQASRHLRSETLGLYKDAVDRFWTTHTFTWTMENGLPHGIRLLTADYTISTPLSPLEARIAALPQLAIVNPSNHGRSTWHKPADGHAHGSIERAVLRDSTWQVGMSRDESIIKDALRYMRCFG